MGARRRGLGDPHADLGAGAGRGLDHQAVVVAVDLPQPLVDVAQPDAVAVGLAGQGAAHRVGSMPTPSSSTQMSASAAVVLGHDRDRARAGLALEAVPDGVLDQRLDAQERHRHRQHLGRDLHGHLQPVAEPGPLQQQVAVDRAQLLGQRRELAVPAERVAGEVGELQQQLAGPLRVGAHERRDRGQRVVDEVRADLGPQRAHLGLHQPGPRRLELGQLELGRHPPRHLVGGPHQARPRSAAPYAARLPTTRSSTMSGATTATRIGQSGSPQSTPLGPSTSVRPLASRRRGVRHGRVGVQCSPAPSQASSASPSVSATAGGAEQAAQVAHRAGRRRRR